VIRARARVWIALVLLLGWHVPALASIGVGLHLAGDDHTRQGIALELALAAAHGHHHAVDAAPHDHSAVRMAAPAAPVPGTAALAIVPAFSSPLSQMAGAQPCESPPRGGPPELYHQNCALRL